MDNATAEAWDPSNVTSPSSTEPYFTTLWVVWRIVVVYGKGYLTQLLIRLLGHHVNLMCHAWTLYCLAHMTVSPLLEAYWMVLDCSNQMTHGQLNFLHLLAVFFFGGLAVSTTHIFGITLWWMGWYTYELYGQRQNLEPLVINFLIWIAIGYFLSYYLGVTI